MVHTRNNKPNNTILDTIIDFIEASRRKLEIKQYKVQRLLLERFSAEDKTDAIN